MKLQGFKRVWGKNVWLRDENANGKENVAQQRGEDPKQKAKSKGKAESGQQRSRANEQARSKRQAQASWKNEAARQRADRALRDTVKDDSYILSIHEDPRFSGYKKSRAIYVDAQPYYFFWNGPQPITNHLSGDIEAIVEGMEVEGFYRVEGTNVWARSFWSWLRSRP